ncbi:MAG: SRPBCC domain-containing protein [Mucilaginibacter sp.]|nr:SRPBCC domain-containing protein [Mucilaginibacter sp.]
MANENVSVEKSFSVGVIELYKAWTEPEALKDWWKPLGRTLVAVDADLKKGGMIKYTFDSVESKDEQLVIEGEYETVLPKEKLVYTWNWVLHGQPVENGAYKLTVGFSEEGEGSKLTIIQQAEQETEGVNPHQEGWEKALQDLDEYLS